MKRLLLLAVLFAAFACGGSNNNEPVVPSTVPSISLSTTQVTIDAAGTAQSVTLSSNVPWSATVSESWLSVSPLSGSGNATLTVSAQANEGPSRSATVTVKDNEGKVPRSFNVTQNEVGPKPVTPNPPQFDGKKRSGLTYQVLVYSFADSDGDGWGDIKGVTQHLDYLDELGVTALWLSPLHPSDSYHGYDVTDYNAINPKLGTEADFQDLLDKARARGIHIYMDYVLNHSGKGHPWFKEALSDPTSPYRNYYFITSNPASDYSSFPMLAGYSYNSGEWKLATSGTPKITVTATDEALTNGTLDWNLYWWTSQGANETRFADNGDGTYSVVMNVNGTIGLLVRKYMNWDTGSKFGAKSGASTITLGTPFELAADGGDISFTGNGRYKFTLSDVNTVNVYFMAAFGEWMPDLNYGAVASAETNDCFKAIAVSADKWIQMGVDGFRLDAVKHICGGMYSFNNTSNQTLLDKWYQRCNLTYKQTGRSGDLFMVGEAWLDHDQERYYYKGIPSCFEFEYWGKLKNALGGSANTYARDVAGYILSHKMVRDDAQTSLFMTNHDQDRAASDLNKNIVKEKQAAAILLTSGGKPFIYQGEELGYWGTKAGGDEYVRTPMKWNKSGAVASSALGGKVDNAMLTESISVEAQTADASSLLNVYKTFAKLRNTYPALAEGEMLEHGTYNSSNGSFGSIACWYMQKDGQKLLVVHNTAASTKSLAFTADNLSKPVALLGEATIQGQTLNLGANSSVVFEL